MEVNQNGFDIVGFDDNVIIRTKDRDANFFHFNLESICYMANKIGRTKNAKLNMISSLFLQVTFAISGLILPRIIIPTYGSEMNGLVASINQFISYISLLEAGVGSVFRASLYKPLLQDNMQKVSGIINEQRRFYRKIGIAFCAYIALLCIFFPLLVKTNLDNTFVIALILILSVGTFLEYFISLPYQSLIMADQMVRLINLLSSMVIICNILATVILAKNGASILSVKLASCIIAAIKPIVFIWYTKTHYSIDPKVKPDSTALSQRWNGMIHHFAYYVHRNTDIVILSIFVGTTMVSVYSIYIAIVTGIERIITSISSSLNAGIGNLLVAGDKKTIDKTVNAFELIQVGTTTVLYTVTALMLMPFIRIYTHSMDDANYIQPIFGYILIAAEAAYCIRCVYSSISMNGNKFKETQAGAILEAIINLSVSLGLVLLIDEEEYKLIAIAVGTLLGMTARLIYEIVYLSRGLIVRDMKKPMKTILISIVASACSISCCSLLLDYNNCNTVGIWILKSFFTFLIVGCVTGMIYLVTFSNTMKDIYRKITHR